MLYLRRRRRTAWIASQIRTPYQDRGFITVPSERGLKKEFRDMLPIMIFNQSFSKEDTQCAVCLGDYEMNEKLQKLPVCGHAFHFECIDHWLANNTTCPLCRTSLLQAGKVVPLDSPAHVTVLQQTHDFVPASSSQQVFPLQDIAVQEGPFPLQDIAVQEGPDMLSIPLEENIRTISGSLSGESNLSSSDIHEGEIYVGVPQHGHTLVTSDGAISAESTET
ncbi:hypothetical protein SUGI_0331200 [Cryptomeria japonica]|nr:hypothetical protein SUGI_0331200 [Cryptomeria japonica]